MKVANLNVEVGRIIEVSSSHDPNVVPGERFMVTDSIESPLIAIDGKYKGQALGAAYISFARRNLSLGFKETKDASIT